MDNAAKPKILSPMMTTGLFITASTFLTIIGIVLNWWIVLDLTDQKQSLFSLLLTGGAIWLIATSCILLSSVVYRLWISLSVAKVVKQATQPATLDAAHPPLVALRLQLRSRYGVFWRLKVRLLLVLGEESAVEALAPALSKDRWQEGAGAVLIYGGQLNAEPDAPLLLALRALCRRRPVDGIVLVQAHSADLTEAKSSSVQRSLENISAILRWQAPVWIWQLVQSCWPQTAVNPCAVGAVLPLKAVPEEVSAQLNQLVPMLRQRGMALVAQDSRRDWLLRLSQQLAHGQISLWQQHLRGWLTSAPRLSLRGLMFSLPASSVEGISHHPHALDRSQGWEGIVADNVKGRRRGLPWEQTLAWALMALGLLWGAGMVMSFALNRQNIIEGAEKAHALVDKTVLNDAQLIALHSLRNALGRQQHDLAAGSPWYQRFGLNQTPSLHRALLPWYGVAGNRLIRDPAQRALVAKLTRLAELPAASPLRATLAEAGYHQLKAWLMMSRPDQADAAFFAHTLSAMQTQQPGISPALWQSLAPDLWAFYASSLSSQPDWAIKPDNALLTQVRQVLLQQIGRRNAESALYQNLLQAVKRHYADVTLEDMTPGTDPRSLFASAGAVSGVFTRQAWENDIRNAIEKAANARRDEIDWVLSDSRNALLAAVSPEALQRRLTQRYFTDFAASWLDFLNGLRLKPANSIADVTDQLTLMSDVRQSPLIALMNTLAWQGQAGQKRAALADTLLNSAKDLIGQRAQPVIDQRVKEAEGPLDATFGPLLSLMGKGSGNQLTAADSSLSLQTYLTRITRVRLRLQQVAAAPDPQERLQALAQTVFQGKSVDLTDTQQYGSLMAASLGEEWSGFGQTLFVQPLTQAWETILEPSALSLNAQWRRAIVDHWRNAFDGRYPFAASQNDASLPMLAEFVRRDAGRIDRFLTSRLGGVLQQEGSRWMPDAAHSQGLTFNPAFLPAVNQLRELADILFTDGAQGISFELQGHAAPGVVETQLIMDGQPLHYFNQMATWQMLRWPGDSVKPGTLLTWTGVKSSAQIYGDYPGTWGFIRWLEHARRERIDRSRWLLNFATSDKRTLTWLMRTQMRDGPLALLRLRGFTLPTDIFTVDAASASEAMAARTASADGENLNMDGAE